MNLTCNSTLDDLRILPTSESKIAGPLTFHDLALIIAGASTLVAILLSFYLMAKHATHYTKPREQKHIIRILFMVPVYAASSFLSLRFYWHAIYFQVISDCYEAFAISSFFALLCSYIAPDLHEQKEFFRMMQPIKPWVMPVNWFAKCCGGQRGPWRTPQSGLTWFNIDWIGIYHYCFIRVAMTITAVVTQYYGKYCESSNSPVFSHIWCLVINAIAVSIAMYCLIQFYVQLREALAEHKPFIKVLAIKLVIFLSFWQSSAISVGTSTLHIVKPGSVLAYPDIKVGIPSLLLCVEMAIFAVMHLWAFPYKPYLDNAKPVFYPQPSPAVDSPPRESERLPRRGGPLGLAAFWDALNLWDVVKAFGRGIRWLFVGVKRRHQDVSYQTARKNSAGEIVLGGLGGKPPGGPRLAADTAYAGADADASTDTITLPRYAAAPEEHAGLMAHAQPDPYGGGLAAAAAAADADLPHHPLPGTYADDYYDDGTGVRYYTQPPPAEGHPPQAGNPRNSTQAAFGAALWGPQGRR